MVVVSDLRLEVADSAVALGLSSKRSMNHTVLPWLVGMMPQSSDMPWTTRSPRPEGSPVPDNPNDGCPGPKSVTCTRIVDDVISIRTEKRDRACLTELVANSDTISSTRSSVSLATLPSRTSITKRRASVADSTRCGKERLWFTAEWARCRTHRSVR